MKMLLLGLVVTHAAPNATIADLQQLHSALFQFYLQFGDCTQVDLRCVRAV